MDTVEASDALILVDMQPDFMEGGPLAVAGGLALIEPVNRFQRRFTHVVATQDWHPPDHLSFARSHPGRTPMERIETAHGPQTLWPAHCVAGTPGAQLHPGLDQARIRAVIRKGLRPGTDSYSGFQENDRETDTGLAGFLAALQVRRIWLAGLALDFCVAWTALDAARLGFEVRVVQDLCRGIGAPSGPGRTTLQDARDAMHAAGIRLLDTP